MWRVQYGNQYDILGYVYALYGPAWKFTIGTNKQSRGHNGSPVSVVLNRRFLVNRGLACNAKQNTLYTFITNDTMQFFSSRRIYFSTSFHHLGAKRFFFALIYSSIEFRRVRNLLEFTLLFPPHYRFLSPSSSENNNDIENKLPPNLKSVIRRKPERGSVYTRKRAIQARNRREKWYWVWKHFRRRPRPIVTHATRFFIPAFEQEADKRRVSPGSRVPTFSFGTNH